MKSKKAKKVVLPSQEKKRQEETNLLKNIAANHKALKELRTRASSHWGYEDSVYRFYHQSFKVFFLQETTKEIVKHLQAMAPNLPLNPWFLDIIQQGTGKEFKMEDNANWLVVTRPILEAF